MKGIPAIWFALILLTFLAILTFWIDRIVKPVTLKPDSSVRHEPDYIINNFVSSRADTNGDTRYSLAAEELRHYPDDDTTELVNPIFTQHIPKPATRMEGERGKVSANGEDVYFMDNVKVVREATPDKGELIILTEYLHIVPDIDFAETDQPVMIFRAPRTVLHGNGMEYYKKDGLFKLFGDVKVHYERPNVSPLTPFTLDQAKKLGKKGRK